MGTFATFVACVAVATTGLALFGTVAGGAPAEQSFGPGTVAFTVPQGVTSITVEASGAQGGGDSGDPQYPQSAGGLGGRVTATIAVTPGDRPPSEPFATSSITQSW